MFQWLKRAGKKIFGGGERTSHIEVKEYDIYEEEITTRDWEKQFKEYCNFDFVQFDKNYKLRLHFKEDETRKEEITQFVKNGMNETGGDLEMVLIGVNTAHHMAVATRGIKEGNQILLFFFN